MLPEGKCRYIDGQIYPDGNFYVLDTQHIKHNGNELKSALNGISADISNKVDKVEGKGLSTEDYTTAEKTKLSGIETNANNYVHPTTSGNKHIPSGGSSGKILGWSADGEAAWVDPSGGGSFAITRYSSTYTVSAYDSYKCNGIATFTVTITSSSSIPANTSIPIAYVASDTVPKGSSSCYYRFVAHSDNTIAQGYIKGGTGILYIKTPTSIPANTNIFITGTYAY